ncbi:hypothetical protein EVAR_88435_1 [Eumeta japonica]|uniref:Uncharacterized protein n=1 Tax=Eumeta variegata TaxID=151549 RepID=A0A4C1Y3J1_EUMVA|nr:hypothetical protein EVAR_88435_1 [Eumeta japonica]
MPKRSKTAQRSSNGDTDQQQSSKDHQRHQPPPPLRPTTTTTEGSTDATTTDVYRKTGKHHKHTDEPVPVAPTDSADARPSEKGSQHANSTRKRTHRIEKPKKSSCAHRYSSQQRLAALETEETDSEDENTVVQDQETQRVGNWVDTQMETLATIDAPHQKNGTTGAKQQNTDELATAARSTRHLQFARPRPRSRVETEQETDRNPDSGYAQQKPRLHTFST